MFFLTRRNWPLCHLKVSCAEKTKRKKKRIDEQQCSIDINILMRRLVTPSGAVSLQSAAEKWVEICFGTVPPAPVYSPFFIPMFFLLLFFFNIVAIVIVCWNKECIISWWICARQDSQKFSHREQIHKIGLVKGFLLFASQSGQKFPWIKLVRMCMLLLRNSISCAPSRWSFYEYHYKSPI